MSYASPFDCPRCGAPMRFTVPDKDEESPLEECVAGCEPLPAVADWRDIPAVAARVVEMDRRGELPDAPA